MFSKKSHPPRLFQPQRLVIWQLFAHQLAPRLFQPPRLLKRWEYFFKIWILKTLYCTFSRHGKNKFVVGAAIAGAGLLTGNKGITSLGTNVAALGKVIYPKYSKHWLFTVANCVCSKLLNHGLNNGLLFSLFKFFGQKNILNQLENSGLKSRFLFLFNISVLIDIQFNLPEISPFLVCPNGLGEHLFSKII